MAERAFTSFHGEAAWAAMPAEARDWIGAIALELFAAWHVRTRVYEDGLPERFARLGQAADEQLSDQLGHAIASTLDMELLDAPDGSPRIPSLLGPACRTCGCTELDACVDGHGRPCGWAAPGLCTSCADGVGRGVEPPTLSTIKAAIGATFADMDRGFARLDAIAGDVEHDSARANPEGLR